MATPLLWMRLPGAAGGLGLALNAAHEANVDGVPDADLIRRALSVAAEIWERDRRDRGSRRSRSAIARPARMLVHIADILAVTTPALTAARGSFSRFPSALADRRHRPLDERREHRPLPRALRMARQAGERVGRVERTRDVRDAGRDERHLAAARAAATETSGNENACRSPVRR